jgi:galactose mutarotase-like enzyme
MAGDAIAGAPLPTTVLREVQTALSATFVPAAGMLCCSLSHRGQELLAQNRGVEAYARTGKTMGIPLLYPWANRLADFGYEAAGASVEVPRDTAWVAVEDHGLPIHGVIGGRMQWSASVEPDGASLSAVLGWDRSDRERFAIFPFEHELHYRARLSGGCLTIELEVRAGDAGPVPLVFGFHPYIAPTGAPRERWQVELPAMRHLALDASQIPTGAGEQRASERFELGGREFDDGFDRVGDPALFAVSDGVRRIELELLDGYPCAQVFAPMSGPFICFEPMAAPANALRSHEGLRLLEPGGSARAAFAVRVSDLH